MPFTAHCFSPANNEEDELNSFWGPLFALDDLDRGYSVLPDGYFPETVTLSQKELGTNNRIDFILESLVISLKAGGESVCTNNWGTGAQCFGQLEGIWNSASPAENFIVTGFGGVDALIFIESGVPNVVTL